MKVKTVIAALAVAAGLVPMGAAAKAGCSEMEQQASLSCADGQTWDSQQQKCVVVGS